MKVFSLVTCCVAMLVFSGCATAPTVLQLTTQFDKTSTAKLLEEGNNTISGSALLRQQGGGVVTCAGNKVRMIPATDYATERMLKIYGSDQKGYDNKGNIRFEPESQEYLTSMREEICDAQGFFEFDRVADGAFYIVTYINWIVGYVNQGANLMYRVEVESGETEKIVLTQ